MSSIQFSVQVYPLKINNTNSKAKHDTCSKLILKTVERSPSLTDAKFFFLDFFSFEFQQLNVGWATLHIDNVKHFLKTILLKSISHFERSRDCIE